MVSDILRPTLEPTSMRDLRISASMSDAERPVSSIERGSAGWNVESSANSLARRLPEVGGDAVSVDMAGVRPEDLVGCHRKFRSQCCAFYASRIVSKQSAQADF